MALSEKQAELLSRRNLVVLATSSLSGVPRAIIVEVNKTEGDKITITDNEMGMTRENIIANSAVCLLVFETDYSYCLKIIGDAQYFACGSHFDFIAGLQTNKGRFPKGAVVVGIKEIIEFK